MNQELRDAIEVARKQEQDGIDFYTEAARKCPSQSGKTMFESFAADERRHLEWVDRMARGLGVDLADAAMPRQAIRSVFDKAAGQLAETAATTQDEKDAVAFALKMETASYRNYEAAAELAEDPVVKEIFDRLAAEENQHYEMLENTLEYLNSSGKWFLFKEGGLLTGDGSSLG